MGSECTNLLFVACHYLIYYLIQLHQFFMNCECEYIFNTSNSRTMLQNILIFVKNQKLCSYLAFCGGFLFYFIFSFVLCVFLYFLRLLPMQHRHIAEVPVSMSDTWETQDKWGTRQNTYGTCHVLCPINFIKFFCGDTPGTH